MIKEVISYKNIVKKIPSLIKESDYKTEFFIKKLELKQATFYRKLRDNDFTVDEVEKIIILTNPDEILKLEFMKAEDDIKNGRLSDHNEVMERLRIKYA
ncbi:MAG TPA: hypothetical protein DCM02_09630 [Flavobacterium sp.]|nr:hypothetical protein [Flavobacterium sp.]